MKKNKRQPKIAQSMGLITLVVLISKLVGFFRSIFFAAIFGTSAQASAYNTATSIVNMLVFILGSGIASSVIPIYSKLEKMQGIKTANHYASGIVNLYFILGIIGSIAGYALAGVISSIVCKGSAEEIALVTHLCRIIFPFMIFSVVNCVFIEILNVNRRFLPAQLLGCALSVTVALACILYGSIEAVAYATGFATIIQFLILLPSLTKVYHHRLNFNFTDQSIKRTIILSIPAIIATVFDSINTNVDHMVGSSMNSSAVATYSYCFTLVGLVLGIIVMPLLTVRYAGLSMLAAEKNIAEFKNMIISSIELLFLVLTPIVIIAIILRQEIIGFVYQRGTFTAQDTANTAAVFACCCVGILGFGLRNFLVRVFYSLQDTKVPMIIGIAAVTLNIIFDFTWVRHLGVPGLALSTSITAWLGTFALLIILRIKIGKLGFTKAAEQMFRIAIASIISGVAVWLSHQGFAFNGSDKLSILIHIALCAGAGITIYIIIAKKFRIRELSSVFKLIPAKR